MPEPAHLRDSTQIVLPCDTLETVREDLESEFTVTVARSDDLCRIIGSPVEIKDVSEYLTRHGIPIA
ncbi:MULTISPECIES: VNG_1110C family protein [unclassified Haloparvum]|uniref:VNG_1110C family protein n=1 Tax=Haloparvum sp. PAK95 TaxID=3418962 RepID=UPI003D2F3A67